jgi:hypothetical protein
MPLIASPYASILIKVIEFFYINMELFHNLYLVYGIRYLNISYAENETDALRILE